MSSDLVLKMAAVYWHSVLIEEPQPLEASESYTVNVTVFVPSYADLGSFTVIRGFGEFIKHHHNSPLLLLECFLTLLIFRHIHSHCIYK